MSHGRQPVTVAAALLALAIALPGAQPASPPAIGQPGAEKAETPQPPAGQPGTDGADAPQPPAGQPGTDGADAPQPAAGQVGADGTDAPQPAAGWVSADGAQAEQPAADRERTTGRTNDRTASHGTDWNTRPDPSRWSSPEFDAIVPDLRARTRESPSHQLRTGNGDERTSPEGFRVAGGRSQAGTGSEVTYTVEAEDAVEVELSELVAEVEDALHGPGSWANDHTLRRVDDPAAATIRVVLATPDTVDALCEQAGLDTLGIFSCWNGRFTALNAWRWAEGAAGFGDDVEGYRRYLVNHEFGHGLGYDHEECPAPGRPAPIMMQQTKGTDGCEPNPWPYPTLASEAAQLNRRAPQPRTPS